MIRLLRRQRMVPVAALQRAPEIQFRKSYFDTHIAAGLVPGWRYDPASGLVYGTGCVWKNTGQTEVTDGAEYVVLRWPD